MLLELCVGVLDCGVQLLWESGNSLIWNLCRLTVRVDLSELLVNVHGRVATEGLRLLVHGHHPCESIREGLEIVVGLSGGGIVGGVSRWWAGM